MHRSVSCPHYFPPDLRKNQHHVAELFQDSMNASDLRGNLYGGKLPKMTVKSSIMWTLMQKYSLAHLKQHQHQHKFSLVCVCEVKGRLIYRSVLGEHNNDAMKKILSVICCLAA